MDHSCFQWQHEPLSKADKEKALKEGCFQGFNQMVERLSWKAGHVIEFLCNCGCVSRWTLTNITNGKGIASLYQEVEALDIHGREFALFSSVNVDHYDIGWRWGQDPKVIYPIYEMAVMKVNIVETKIVEDGIIGHLKYADINQPRPGQGITGYRSNYRIVYVKRDRQNPPCAMARLENSQDPFLPHHRTLTKPT